MATAFMLYVCIGFFMFLCCMGMLALTASPNEKQEETVQNIIQAIVFSLFWPVFVILFFLT